ncbi:TPA: RusA family crossover junction endodeoxyribonuclease [Proteus mirabilis]
MPELMLTLPFPPSVNSYWRNTKRGTLVSAKGRAFRANAIAAVYEQLKRRPKAIYEQLKRRPKAIESNVFVLVKLYPPTKQARDIDNFLKAPFDALTHAGVWVDDKQIKKMDVEWMDVIKGGKLEITIRQHSKSVMYGHE